MADQTQNFEPLLKTKFDYIGTWSTRHGWECDLKLMTVKMGSYFFCLSLEREEDGD